MATHPPIAMQKLFDIPELVEQVLLHVPFKWLLLSRRTYSAFREAIDSSPSLRRKLYLEPAAARSNGTLELGPFFVRGCSFSPSPNGSSPRLNASFTYLTFSANGLISDGTMLGDTMGFLIFIGSMDGWPFVGSWQPMLATQPLVQDLVLECRAFPRAWQTIRVHADKGVRWSHIFAEATRAGCDMVGVNICGGRQCSGNPDIRLSTVEWS